MNTKHIVIISAVIILAVGGGVYFFTQEKPITTPVLTNTQTSSTAVAYKMVTTSNGLYEYPQVIDYPNAATMNKVNQALVQTFKDFGCDENTPIDKSTWNLKVAIDYAKNDIFSVNVHGDYNCGGPYPTTNYSSTQVFDMKTGNQVTFEQLFADYKKDTQKIITSIYKDVLDATSEYILKNPNDDNNCAAANTYTALSETTQDYRLSTKPGVIEVRPNYPHVSEACTPEVEIAVQQLLSFVDATSLLNRI